MSDKENVLSTVCALARVGLKFAQSPEIRSLAFAKSLGDFLFLALSGTSDILFSAPRERSLANAKSLGDFLLPACFYPEINQPATKSAQILSKIAVCASTSATVVAGDINAIL